ncbi:MAG: LPXTG cell wall anchor domain-containing protein [Nocardioidaceae bacterium]|nr:LPXTG cell wall anchor domain-containing protein [Nocardioidaceae bacterium]
MKRLLAFLVLSWGLVLPSAGAAGELGLSPDGVTWASQLPGPIFDPAFRWVPGDSETGTFYVRNQSADLGLLGLTMQSSQVTDLIDLGDLTVSTRLDGGAWTEVSTSGPHTLLTEDEVEPGAVRRIDVRVALDPASGNASQDKALDLRFLVTLHQGPVVSQPGDGDGGGDGDGSGTAGPGGHLPNTGSDVQPWMFLVSGLSIALGVVLARRSSKKDKAHA